MILYYSPNSPYARIARIALREAGILERVEERVAVLRKPENPVLPFSPLGRVPTLVMGDTGIADTGRVVASIAAEAGRPALAPAPVSDPAMVALEGLVLGLLDALVTLRREGNRPEALRSAEIAGLETTRAERALTRLEAEADGLPEFPAFAAVALAVTLHYLDFAALMPGWAARFPALAAWLERMRRHGSMIETAPV